ncbi:MAG TPA: hypothetical protein VGL35_03990 [Rhizomicrobium sp.]
MRRALRFAIAGRHLPDHRPVQRTPMQTIDSARISGGDHHKLPGTGHFAQCRDPAQQCIEIGRLAGDRLHLAGEIGVGRSGGVGLLRLRREKLIEFSPHLGQICHRGYFLCAAAYKIRSGPLEKVELPRQCSCRAIEARNRGSQKHRSVSRRERIVGLERHHGWGVMLHPLENRQQARDLAATANEIGGERGRADGKACDLSIESDLLLFELLDFVRGGNQLLPEHGGLHGQRAAPLARRGYRRSGLGDLILQRLKLPGGARHMCRLGRGHRAREIVGRDITRVARRGSQSG